jgi:DNA-binding GntR family transcriptional regulator
MPELEFTRPIEVASASDRVTEELRASILAGRLRPGQEFSLRQIAAELGVSFIPVREALRSLEAEGLLYTRKGRSAVVTPLTHEELDGAFRLRRQIEPELAAAAAPLHQPKQLDQLAESLLACQDSHTSADQHASVHIEVQLNLLRPAATPIDERLIVSLIHVTSRYSRVAYEAMGSPPEQHRAEDFPQVRVLEAFRSGDPRIARDAMLRRMNSLERLSRAAVPSSRTAAPTCRRH